MEPTFFTTADDFRRWLQEHHATVAELWVGFRKKASGIPSITYPEAVDEALCFGWIDGLKKSVDETNYTLRFTPRRPRSTWSQVNLRRARELITQGRMAPPGLAAFEAWDPDKARPSSENRPRELDQGLQAELRAHPAAWEHFQAQPPGYRRAAIGWITSAKRDETRHRRLAQVIEASARGERLGVVTGGKSGS
jgi:uncharacterized protein YdeI (YjbR/CyaY-like superfamily)